MEFTAKQIAGILNGQIEGDADAKITKLSKIEEGEPGSISFLANPAYTHYIYDTKASLVIVNKDFVWIKRSSSLTSILFCFFIVVANISRSGI